MPLTRARVALVTAITLVAFAANSVLCRMALGPDLIDPVAFTAIRLGSGVLALLLLSRLVSEPRPEDRMAGSWRASLALFVYAIAFSLAYVSLETGTGALILFGSIQVTMITAGLWAGERPRPGEWLGLLSAMGGLAYLVSPGIGAPDPIAALLMTASGIAWGAYSVGGKGSSFPVSATAGNFVRTLPLAIVGILCSWETLHASARGVALAVSSGALTSGLGYVLWFIALRGLTATRAAIVQLAAPVIAAAGGIVVLAEEPTLRLAVASIPILGGVGAAILSRDRSGAIDPCEGSPDR